MQSNNFIPNIKSNVKNIHVSLMASTYVSKKTLKLNLFKEM